MKTLTDLRLEYKQETGLEVILTAYGFRPYLAWLEERLLKELNKTVYQIEPQTIVERKEMVSKMMESMGSIVQPGQCKYCGK